jgi:hypothetical protein
MRKDHFQMAQRFPEKKAGSGRCHHLPSPDPTMPRMIEMSGDDEAVRQSLQLEILSSVLEYLNRAEMHEKRGRHDEAELAALAGTERWLATQRERFPGSLRALQRLRSRLLDEHELMALQRTTRTRSTATAEAHALITFAVEKLRAGGRRVDEAAARVAQMLKDELGTQAPSVAEVRNIRRNLQRPSRGSSADQIARDVLQTIQAIPDHGRSKEEIARAVVREAAARLRVDRVHTPP